MRLIGLAVVLTLWTLSKRGMLGYIQVWVSRRRNEQCRRQPQRTQDFWITAAGSLSRAIRTRRAASQGSC